MAAPEAASSGRSQAGTPASAAPRAGGREQILRQYELVELVKSYDPGADEDLLNRAYVFAMRAHGPQRRASGDPYFHHPVQVAGILAQYRLDSATIATGLLHDVVEDTGVALSEIERLFGPTVARLVDGVTKLGKIRPHAVKSSQAENFRKLLLAMSDDIRVLLVKLADRLHNMRTLHFVRDPDKRSRIARETLEIYAPLAERIGMNRMKVELEDLAFAELWPDARASILRRLEQLRRDDTDLVGRICRELQKVLAEAGIEAEVSGREKTPLSIWRKMQRKHVNFEQLSDIVAFRVIVRTVGECYAALGVIHARYTTLPGRFKDFISIPKPNGYRSLHTTILGPEGRKIEIQIRTHEMHEVAELGVAAHWAYKQEQPVTDGRRYRWVRELLEILEHAETPDEFLENTKLDLHQDQVFVFTPKGDVIALPRGATPVDFAYAIHSEVGDHCVGAKIDGRIVPLHTRLANGDQVEIITSRNASPSPEWERFVVTGKARTRIRRALRSKQRASFVARGRELLNKLAKSEQLSLTERQLEEAARSFRYADTEAMLAAVGEGRLHPRLVLETVRPELRERTRKEARRKVVPFPVKGRKKTTSGEEEGSRPASSEDGPILGLPRGLAFNLARCCHPIRGDDIYGVIRSGRPLTIHHADCSVLARLRESGAHALAFFWRGTEGDDDSRYVARIRVMVLNRPNVLGQVATTIGRLDINITDLRTGGKSRNIYELFMDVEVRGVLHLQQLLAALRASPETTYVERVVA